MEHSLVLLAAHIPPLTTPVKFLQSNPPWSGVSILPHEGEAPPSGMKWRLGSRRCFRWYTTSSKSSRATMDTTPDSAAGSLHLCGFEIQALQGVQSFWLLVSDVAAKGLMLGFIQGLYRLHASAPRNPSLTQYGAVQKCGTHTHTHTHTISQITRALLIIADAKRPDQYPL